MKLSLMLTCLTVLASAALTTPAEARPETVAFPQASQLETGTIVILASKRQLFLVIDSAHAIRYPVAVPKGGKEWKGTAHVDGKYLRPAWSPPAEVKHDHPELPDVIEGGAPNNPMGAAALTLDKSEIAIHGTTQKMRKSIGSAASYGCIRMLNEDISDLYERVEVGTLVVMRP